MVFLAGILPVPVLIDGVCDLGQPGPILDQVQKIRRGEKLDTIGWRVAEWFEQSV